MSPVLIKVDRLGKVFRQGFWMRRVEAVKEVSFEVQAGHIYGFLGPNGAGKTTTIKMLTGLIRPTSGEASIFGERVPSPRAMRRVGFLPENPYVYPYLTPREFVEMCGRLSGLSGTKVRKRAEEVLDQTGVLYAADRQVRRLSKGMLQRTGLAAALVSDPELLILDEPMSGLDPVGRKEVRDLILSERDAGRTIFFSTHILSDVERICDHVTILRNGRVVVTGELAALLRRDVQRTDVTVVAPPPAFEEWCKGEGHSLRRAGTRVSVEVQGAEALQTVVRKVAADGVVLAEVVPRTETLENLFVREAIDESNESPS
ncbi:MAG TPA: ABC transporter ATP-binding protein [Polyangiaceae bacterium]|nr:ABC transporter ATP-binding protein [Polyangiaceae bacterium]